MEAITREITEDAHSDECVENFYYCTFDKFLTSPFHSLDWVSSFSHQHFPTITISFRVYIQHWLLSSTWYRNEPHSHYISINYRRQGLLHECRRRSEEQKTSETNMIEVALLSGSLNALLRKSQLLSGGVLGRTVDSLGLGLGLSSLVAGTVRGSLGNGDGFLAPEILLALAGANKPRREEATGNAVSPGLLESLVGGHDAAARSLLDQPDGGVDDNVRAHTGDQTVGNGVGKGHERNGEESRNGIAQVAPVDLSNGLHHHGTDQNQHAASGPRRDRGKDGSKEDGDEEADTGHHGSETSLATFRDTSTGLDKGGDWGSTEQSTNGDADGVDHVGDRGTLEVLGNGINQIGELGHGVQGTRAVEDIDVEEGDQGKAKLSTVAANGPLLHTEGLGDLVEVHNLLEEVKGVVANLGVREVGDAGGTRPRNDADQDDTGNDGTLEAVHHQDYGKNTTTEDTNPHGRVAHLGAAWAETILLQGLDTSGELEGCVGGSHNETQTLAVSQTDQGKEQTDTDTRSELDRLGNRTSQPLSHTKEGQGKEDPALNEDGRKSNRVRDRAGTVVTNNSVGKVGVQTHSRGQRDGPTDTY